MTERGGVDELLVKPKRLGFVVLEAITLGDTGKGDGIFGCQRNGVEKISEGGIHTRHVDLVQPKFSEMKIALPAVIERGGILGFQLEGAFQIGKSVALLAAGDEQNGDVQE